MEQVMYNPITDDDYIGIITILDYEARMRKCMTDALNYIHGQTGCKVIVDLALKVGLSKYRFVEYNISHDGQIAWNSNRYVTPSKQTVDLADSFIRKRRQILEHSMLSRSERRRILQTEIK
jgi:hypothetical protein